MKKALKALAFVAATYLLASTAFSIAHAHSDDQWAFRQHRNGLLCVEHVQHSDNEGELIVYSPFCNWADVFLFGVCWGETERGVEWYTYSDGFDCFGQF